MPTNHLTLCCSLLLLPSIFPSIRVFFNELALRIRWPKYWSFTFSMSPSNEYSVLISFRINWFDLPVVQGTHGSFLSTTVWKHLFFSAQPSLWSNFHICIWLLEKHSFNCMDFCWQSDVSAFNMLSMFIIAFLPRSKHSISFNFMKLILLINFDSFINSF